MKRFFILSIALCLGLSSYTPPDPKFKTVSNLHSVTIYRNGAEMEHTAFADLRAGDNELVIEGLSSYLDINSIQVNCPAAVTILGIEFNNNYLGEENISPVVKQLKDSLQDVSDAIQKINIQINTANELLDVLRVNKDVKGTQSGLSVAELTKLINYYEQKSLEVQTNLAAYQKRKAKLEQLSGKINSQIMEEQKKNTRSGGRLNLQLSVAIGGNHKFDISYITHNALWTPYYDIKSDNIKSPLKFIYKARISQTTGIDWKKVKLSLSTSSPRQYGNAPLFRTWFLGYIDPVNIMNQDLSRSNSIPSSTQELKEVVVTGVRSSSSSRYQNNEPLYIVNGSIMSKADYMQISPGSFKNVRNISAGEAVATYGSPGMNGAVVATLKDGLEDYISVSESELELTYDISLPYDVPTNGKPQVATLKETSIPANYKYYAVPKLDKDAYLLAEVPNWQTLNLLPGEANIIFEGTYIGKSFIDPSNTSDTLNLTLGTDKRVVVKREKMTDYSSVKFLGTNKLQTLTYEITVKNNKNEPVNLILKDQFPVSTNKEIIVELLESSKGSINSEIGVVTWQMKIDPGKSEKRRISYSVKYPKGKMLNLY